MREKILTMREITLTMRAQQASMRAKYFIAKIAQMVTANARINLVRISFGRGQKISYETIVPDHFLIISGGISYVEFGIKLRWCLVSFVPRQMGHSLFCSRQLVFQGNSLGQTIFLRCSGMIWGGPEMIKK